MPATESSTRRIQSSAAAFTQIQPDSARKRLDVDRLISRLKKAKAVLTAFQFDLPPQLLCAKFR